MCGITKLRLTAKVVQFSLQAIFKANDSAQNKAKRWKSKHDVKQDTIVENFFARPSTSSAIASLVNQRPENAFCNDKNFKF